MSRIEPRVERLMAAHGKLVAKVEAFPDHPNVNAWKARVLEYENSLESMRVTGKEFVVGAVGVEIDVPVSGFTIETPGE